MTFLITFFYMFFLMWTHYLVFAHVKCIWPELFLIRKATQKFTMTIFYKDKCIKISLSQLWVISVTFNVRNLTRKHKCTFGKSTDKTLYHIKIGWTIDYNRQSLTLSAPNIISCSSPTAPNILSKTKAKMLSM